MDLHVGGILEGLSAAERRSLWAIVTGDHQARRRSLAMQYFLRVMNEPADAEDRVIYAEGVADEAGALDLARTRQIDRRIASAFFGDPKRMQRDLLGQTVEAELKTFAVSPGARRLAEKAT